LADTLSGRPQSFVDPVMMRAARLAATSTRPAASPFSPLALLKDHRHGLRGSSLGYCLLSLTEQGGGHSGQPSPLSTSTCWTLSHPVSRVEPTWR
jgi:hypothetical protein